MSLSSDLAWVFGAIGGVLVLGSIAAIVLAMTARSEGAKRTAYDVRSRVIGWWFICACILGAIWLGRSVTTCVFGFISFLTYREFVTITNTRRADQRTLFWTFFILIPLQFVLIDSQWYGLWSIFIPVYTFVAFTIFCAMKGDATRFLERSATIFFGIMICVYFVSHLPALSYLDLTTADGAPFPVHDGRLLLFLLVVSQLNDVFQYCWGKTLGRRQVAPHLSPNKTWEGLIGGMVCATGIAASLWWLTPAEPWQAACIGALICCLGFAGDIILSAIKRDTGIKDYGHLLGSHGGILDRVDSLCFSAPVLYHILHFYFSPGITLA